MCVFHLSIHIQMWATKEKTLPILYWLCLLVSNSFFHIQLFHIICWMNEWIYKENNGLLFLQCKIEERILKWGQVLNNHWFFWLILCGYPRDQKLMKAVQKLFMRNNWRISVYFHNDLNVKTSVLYQYCKIPLKHHLKSLC
jgi:hypothetical protein